MPYDIAPPAPVGRVASLSAPAYSLPDASADLIDHSASAEAGNAETGNIDVEFAWAGPAPSPTCTGPTPGRPG